MRGLAWLPTLAVLLSGAPAAADTLRVVTFNAYAMPFITESRAPRVRAAAKEIARLRPHVVALQEIWVEDDARMFADAMRAAGLPHAIYFASSQPAAVGGAGLLIASAYPLASSEFRPFTLGRHPHTPWHLDWMSRKGVATARIQAPGFELVVANTHMQADYQTATYLPVRLGQALEVVDCLGAPGLAPGSAPGGQAAILVGDLNSLPADVDFELMAGAGQLTNAVPDCELDAVLYRSGDDVTMRPRRVERILDAPVTVDDGSVTRLSDHAGILVEFDVTPGPAAPAVRAQSASWKGHRARVAIAEALAASRSTARWSLVLACLVAAGAAAAFVAARRRSMGRRRAWKALSAGLALAATYVTYLGVGYAPARTAGLEWAERRLSREASPAVLAQGRATADARPEPPPP